MPIEIATTKDYKNIKELWQKLFQDSEEFIEYYFNIKVLTNEILCYKKNKKIISMIHLNPYYLSINNNKQQFAYYVGVGTDVDYQNKGYMRYIMEYSLNYLYEKGHSISILMPIDDRIYKRFGFSFITKYYEVYLCKEDLNTIKDNRYYITSKIKEDKIADISTFYQNMMNNYQVYIERNKNYYNEILKELDSEKGIIIGSYKGEKLAGYIMIYNNSELCEIREIMYDNYETLEILLSYIKENSNSKMIKINTHRLDIRHFIPFTKNIKRIIKPYIMARIINVRKILQFIYSKNKCIINIKVNDSIIKHNNGVFKLDLRVNESIVKNTNEDSDIELDIGTLVQLIMGFETVEELIKVNKIIVNNKGIINEFKNIFFIKNIFINEIV
ncbi:MAG: enhanced intracellular survival protein Eis [Eubacteriales bacterium]